MAFEHAFYMAYLVKLYIQMKTGLALPLCIMPEILSLFDVLPKASSTTRSGLKTYFKTIQNSYDETEI